jgi:hypothetical protein
MQKHNSLTSWFQTFYKLNHFKFFLMFMGLSPEGSQVQFFMWFHMSWGIVFEITKQKGANVPDFYTVPEYLNLFLLILKYGFWSCIWLGSQLRNILYWRIGERLEFIFLLSFCFVAYRMQFCNKTIRKRTKYIILGNYSSVEYISLLT